MLGNGVTITINYTFLKREVFSVMILSCFKVAVKSEKQDAEPRNILTYKSTVVRPGVVAHSCNPSTGEAEAGRFLSSSPSWST